MPLSERVHCVAPTFKMTERVEQRVCKQLWVRPEHSSAETARMTQKGHGCETLVTGSLFTATCPLMHHVSCGFLVKHQITRVTQPPYSPDLVPCAFWLFPKVKSPLKGKRFQAISEVQEDMTGQLMATGRTV